MRKNVEFPSNTGSSKVLFISFCTDYKHTNARRQNGSLTSTGGPMTFAKAGGITSAGSVGSVAY